MTRPPKSTQNQPKKAENESKNDPKVDATLPALRWTFVLIPLIAMFYVWFSVLGFVPVPWPDDSAFYFVAKYLFQWPPRWVMIPQAPFEPTYRIWNFNTMPIYPILIGLGRFIGIDGSFAIKFWPLSAWAGSISLLCWFLYKQGLSFRLTLLLCFSAMLSPIQRWGSVIVRPETLIALIGVILVLDLNFGILKRFQPRSPLAKKIWHPISFLLALGAYIHFNAIHLLFILIPTLITRPRKLIEIGSKTLLYMLPWVISAFFHWTIFWKQMNTQFTRLSVGNAWLDSPKQAIDALIQDMGSPLPWAKSIKIASIFWWVLIYLALIILAIGLFKSVRNFIQKNDYQKSFTTQMVPAAGWVLGSCWLWNNKPEVWFVYYIHVALTVFTGSFLYYSISTSSQLIQSLRNGVIGSLSIITVFCLITNVDQVQKLSQSPSWKWSTYYAYVDCIDGYLKEREAKLGFPKPFRVWDPTYPDTIIELSRRHPDWEFTRTNDFHDREPLAIQHGQDVEAMIINETVNYSERFIQGPFVEYPDVKSIWMEWDGYYLSKFHKTSGFKPDRFICQRGRWVSFIYLKS